MMSCITSLLILILLPLHCFSSHLSLFIPLIYLLLFHQCVSPAQFLDNSLLALKMYIFAAILHRLISLAFIRQSTKTHTHP